MNDPEVLKKYNKQESGSGIGVYKFPGNDEELWCTSHPQADAAVRQGWVFARALPTTQEISALHTSKDAKENEAKEKASQNHVAETGRVVGESQGTAKRGNK